MLSRWMSWAPAREDAAGGLELTVARPTERLPDRGHTDEHTADDGSLRSLPDR